MPKPVVFRIEVVETVEGLWCRDCLAPSGVKITTCLSGLRVGTFMRCRDCSGCQIDPAD